MNKILSDLLIESSIDAMIAIEFDNRVIAWNRAAAILYDWEREEAIDKDLGDLLPSITEDGDFLKAIQMAKEGIQSFIPASRQFVHTRHVETHIIPLKSDGEIMGVMLLAHDVSHRVLKEEELQYLNNELKDRIRQLKVTTRELAQLTHIATFNIKEPLRIIYTTIERLIETEARSISNSGRASFRRIQSSLNRMNLLLDDINTLTQINIVERPDTMIKMDELIPEVTKFLEQKIRSTRATITTGKLCDIRAHRNQVFLLLQHIVSNAIRFNESGEPFVNISCQQVSDNDDPSIREKNGGYSRLVITHNGNGFENKDSNGSPEPFANPHENSYMGSGIATAIAVKVMEAHKGFLGIENDKQGNTVIKCFFPS